MGSNFMRHKHHIIPRHMGGTDDPINLVELTILEHSDAHFILWLLHGKYEDFCASILLLTDNFKEDSVRLRGRLGGRALKGIKKSAAFKEKARQNRLGKKWSQETKDKIRASRLKVIADGKCKEHPWKGRKVKDVLSPEKYEKFLSDCKKNSSHPGSKNGFYGKTHSEISISKMLKTRSNNRNKKESIL